MIQLSDDDLRSLVPMSDAIAAVSDGFARSSADLVDQPQRVGFADGRVLAMLAGGHKGDGCVAKIVSTRSGAAKNSQPNIQGVAIWFNAEGEPKLLIDGPALTALRTGAASGVATQILASHDARVLTVIGCGAQAPDQVRGVCAVRNIEEVRLVSRSHTSAVALAEILSVEFPLCRVVPAKAAEDALLGADIICCATDSIDPVINGENVHGRVHVNAIGSFRPKMRELPRDLVATAEIVCVDQVDAACAEAGEVIDGMQAGVLRRDQLVELGVLVGQPRPSPSGITVFKSVGVAIQDWAVANLVANRLWRTHP
jgi:ornithine cyclodeaminase